MHYLPLQNAPRFVCARTHDGTFAPYLTNRFHLPVAGRVYPDNTQVMSKRGNWKKPQAGGVTDVSCVIRVHTHGQMESIFLKTSLIAVIPLACVASVSVLFYARSALASNFRAAINRKILQTCRKPYGSACYGGYYPAQIGHVVFLNLCNLMMICTCRTLRLITSFVPLYSQDQSKLAFSRSIAY